MLSAVLQKAANERPKRGRKNMRAPVASLGVSVQERIRTIESQDMGTNTDVRSVEDASTQIVYNTADVKIGGDEPIVETTQAETQTSIEMQSKACDTGDLEKHIKEARLKKHMKKQAEIAAAQRLVLGAPAGDESDE